MSLVRMTAPLQWSGNEGLDYMWSGLVWQYRKRARHRFVTKLHIGAVVSVHPTSRRRREHRLVSSAPL